MLSRQQPRSLSVSVVAFTRCFGFSILPMLLAVATMSLLEVSVLRLLGIRYIAKAEIRSVGTLDFSLVHGGRRVVSRVVFAQAGLSTSYVRDLLLHDLGTSERVVRLNASHLSPDLFAVSSQGNRLAIASSDGTIRLWDSLTTDSPPIKLNLPGSETLYSMVCSDNGEMLIGAGQDYIYVWECSTGRLLRQMRHSGCGAQLCLSNDSRSLLYASCDGDLQFWDVLTGRLASELHLSDSVPVHATVLSPDSTLIAQKSYQGVLSIIDRTRGTILWRGKVGHRSPLAFSSDSSRLATVHRTERLGYEIRIWNSHTGKVLSRFAAHEDQVTSLSFAPSGLLISSDLGGVMRKWDQEGRAIWDFSIQEWAQRESTFRRHDL